MHFMQPDIESNLDHTVLSWYKALCLGNSLKANILLLFMKVLFRALSVYDVSWYEANVVCEIDYI